MPEVTTSAIDGAWIIEGHGVGPDIVVANDARSGSRVANRGGSVQLRRFWSEPGKTCGRDRLARRVRFASTDGGAFLDRDCGQRNSPVDALPQTEIAASADGELLALGLARRILDSKLTGRSCPLCRRVAIGKESPDFFAGVLCLQDGH